MQDGESFSLRFGDVSIRIPYDTMTIVGRFAPTESDQPDIDLGPFGAQVQGISRRHIYIRRVGEDFFVADLNSTNGTWLNGERLEPSAEYLLRDGDLLKLANLRTVIVFDV